MKNSEWRDKFLEAVSNCSNEGKEAVDYIRAHRTYISIKRARKSVGAFWSLTRGAHLNSAHYSQDSSLTDPNAWVLLIHEVRHLQQGTLTALSIYGELDAWQYQWSVFEKLVGKQTDPLLEKILSLSLNMERENLRYARMLMTQYAGKSYGANWLPLYPIHKEITYWFTKRKS